MKGFWSSRSFQIYLGLVAFSAALLLLFVFVPVAAITPAQAGTFTWPVLILAFLIGLAGLWAAQKMQFPEFWDAKITNRQRLLIPAGLGLVAGLVFLALGRLQPLGEINVPFPLSIPYYLYGGIVSEILYRLFLISILTWFISGVLLKYRGQQLTFWIVAIITSLLEPLGQLGTLYQLGLLRNGFSPVLGVMLALAFAVNLLAAYLFRKFGFVAPLILRIAFYIVWHMV